MRQLGWRCCSIAHSYRKRQNRCRQWPHCICIIPGKKCIQNGRGICHAQLKAHFGHDFIPWEDNSGLISLGETAIFSMVFCIMSPLICAIHLAA
jgi:hypothetical protein